MQCVLLFTRCTLNPTRFSVMTILSHETKILMTSVVMLAVSKTRSSICTLVKSEIYFESNAKFNTMTVPQNSPQKSTVVTTDVIDDPTSLWRYPKVMFLTAFRQWQLYAVRLLWDPQPDWLTESAISWWLTALVCGAAHTARRVVQYICSFWVPVHK